ncbi:MAG TPA: universal stress protein [Nitrospinota bacterium]|nr:universal stress protein [Nitrospinota bacterium]|tara:strand:+ start:68434 stop:69615 length:1182 start_codon:yes stop_codon:yes gene_type:complete
MFNKILIMLDNSDYSTWALDSTLDIADQFGSNLTGAHVYAARLHETRFVQMEPGLPAEFQDPVKLQEQRDIHSELIEHGLHIISDSYLDVFRDRCSQRGISHDSKSMEGRNYSELVRDIRNVKYDLVAMGAKGLGEVKTSQLGSVCERVTRRVQVDTLVIKRPLKLKNGHVVVGIDGSEQSFAAMHSAIQMSKRLDCKITALTVFDPDFHSKVFNSISSVLSKEASDTFKFEQQEQLHDQIIDSGLEKIYRDHLEKAKLLAEEAGVQIESFVLAGKAYDEILKWLNGKDIALLILGKIGVHGGNELDIGSNAENLLRNANCNVMLVSRRSKPKDVLHDQGEIEWSNEAIELLERVPGFVRNMVRGHMESQARITRASIITADMMKEARKQMGM